MTKGQSMFEFSIGIPEATKVALVDYVDRWHLTFTMPDGGTVVLAMDPASFDAFEDFIGDSPRLHGSWATL